MKKQELIQFVRDNAEAISQEIKNSGKSKVAYISEGGRIGTKQVNGWETALMTFGNVARLNRKHIRQAITPELVIAQAEYELTGHHDYMSPVDEIISESLQY